MKLNKKRKDARLPNWLIEVLGALQIKYQWTFTEALIRTAEKGSVYYNKQWEKMHGKGSQEEAAPKGAEKDERCPNDHQDNNKAKEKKHKEIPDIMVDLMLAIYSIKDHKILWNKYYETIDKPYDEGKINLTEVLKRCSEMIKEDHLEEAIKKLHQEQETRHKKKAE